jgi:hypothetical protein
MDLPTGRQDCMNARVENLYAKILKRDKTFLMKIEYGE